MLKKIAYGALGMSVSTLLTVNFLTAMPTPYTPTDEGAIGQPEEERDALEEALTNGIPLWEENENGEAVKNGNGGIQPMPAVFKTYHITGTGMEDLQKAGVVTFGRTNPMGYWEPTENPETETITFNWESTLSDETKTNGEAVDWDAVVRESKLGSDKTIGYDKSAAAAKGGEQLKEVSTSAIAETFKRYGVLPVDQKHYQISSTYGPRVDPFTKGPDVFHSGLDISSTTINGEPVYSVLPGVVKEVGVNPDGYGNYAIINHGDFDTLYGHMLEEVSLTTGTILKAGDKIGLVGSTGRSTGPHIHLEVLVGDIMIDPHPFMQLVGMPDNPNKPKEVFKGSGKPDAKTETTDTQQTDKPADKKAE